MFYTKTINIYIDSKPLVDMLGIVRRGEMELVDTLKVDVQPINKLQIQKEYGKYAMIVLSGIQEPGFKIDPVEFTEGFAEKFQEVMWKVEEEIDKVGDLHTIYQRWSLREKYFAEMNITWRNPKTMNPDVMFD